MSSNNYIITGEAVYNEILAFCRESPQEAGKLFQALAQSFSYDSGFGEKQGKIGFSTIKHWREKRKPEETYEFDSQ